MYDPGFEEFCIRSISIDASENNEDSLPSVNCSFNDPSFLICTSGHGLIENEGISKAKLDTYDVYFIKPNTSLKISSDEGHRTDIYIGCINSSSV